MATDITGCACMCVCVCVRVCACVCVCLAAFLLHDAMADVCIHSVPRRQKRLADIPAALPEGYLGMRSDDKQSDGNG